MKTNLLKIAIALVLSTVWSFGLAGEQKSDGTKHTAFLNVKGMTCGGCASQVKSALTSVEGVKECQVDWKTGKAEVGFEGDQGKAQELVSAVNQTHFKASLASVSLSAAASKEESSKEAASKQSPKSTKRSKAIEVSAKNIFSASSYVCTHCNYSQSEKGKCPSCGMKLAEAKHQHTFACAHCNYTSVKPGKCPSCKAELTEYNIAYQCPSCENQFSEAGKCPDCKKTLQVVTGEPILKLEFEKKKSLPDQSM
jgi:copper chaperone CopZ